MVDTELEKTVMFGPSWPRRRDGEGFVGGGKKRGTGKKVTVKGRLEVERGLDEDWTDEINRAVRHVQGMWQERQWASGGGSASIPANDGTQTW